MFWESVIWSFTVSTLLLTSPVASSSPGQAAWSSSNAVFGPLLTNLPGESQPLVLPDTNLPLAGVTIPANTLVDGAVIFIQAPIFIDTFAAGGIVDVVLGLSISGQTTQSGTGIIRFIQLQPGPIYGGNVTVCCLFSTNGNQCVVNGTSFLDDTGTSGPPLPTTNGQTRLVGANVGIDPAQPCSIFPVVTPLAADPGVTVSAGQFTAVVRLP
jgi:hypothetical protein